MARFTQQQRNIARERFLSEHPEIKKHIDSISQEYATTNFKGNLEECRILETMLAIDEYAEKNGIDDHELFLHYVADSSEEFQRLLAEWRAMIAEIDK